MNDQPPAGSDQQDTLADRRCRRLIMDFGW
jgi:hypothetical protein